MDSKHVSSEELSPQTIVRFMEALAGTDGPIRLHELERHTNCHGYDWAARMIVADVLRGGADPWYVLRVLGRMVHAAAEQAADEPGAQQAIEMLDLAEQLRLGQLDPQEDNVRWRLAGMAEESRGSQHVNNAAHLLGAALVLVLGADDDDVSAADAQLVRAARDITADAVGWQNLRCRHRGETLVLDEAEAWLCELRGALAAAPRRTARGQTRSAQNGARAARARA